MSASKARITRLRIEVSGTVQGVGFRPYCYHLAHKLKLTGWINNQGQGVTIEVQGHNPMRFINQLPITPPDAARIEHISHSRVNRIDNENEFIIKPSHVSTMMAQIPTDRGLCAECLNELFDPKSRYYRYPFIGCTQCGPRYSLITSLPYDRKHTSMHKFHLCPLCKAAYHDKTNRRFHAQSIACALCGPQLKPNNIKNLSHYLRTGKIVAIKNTSGFHLICNAYDAQAIDLLRQHKNRQKKPFALMCSNIESARRYAHLDEQSENLLISPQRPIVIVKKKFNCALATNIAPDVNTYGLMLPYTPLQYLIFNELAGRPSGVDWLSKAHDIALLVTSANLSGEPVIIDNAQAKTHLKNIADLIIDHDLNIVTHADDSIVKATDNQTVFIRRARAFSPQAIQLNQKFPPLLAVGGEGKNTICLIRDNNAFISQYIGDLNNSATLSTFEETILHMQKILSIQPIAIAHDLHPDFYSTRYAQSQGLTTFAIQHHHAHLAGVAAEYHINQPALGLALDGYGLGNDKQAWGGELLLIHQAHAQRLGHLRPLNHIGGDLAAKEPWRMAAAVLALLGRENEIPQRFPYPQAAALRRQLNITTALTSSCGRLFDAAASLLGITDFNHHDGQAAMELESLVTKPRIMEGGWRIHQNQLDFYPLLNHLIDLHNPREGANLFHGTLIEGLCTWVAQQARQHNINVILLSGGCMLNQIINQDLLKGLRKRGLHPLLPQQHPPNDAGLSLGQAWITGLKLTQNTCI